MSAKTDINCCYVWIEMIIDCETALVIPGCAQRPRYSRAKVGVATDHSGATVLVVITSQAKEKFRIVNNCTVRSTTISFVSPKRDLYLRNFDNILFKALMSLITRIKTNQSIPKLASVSSVEKLKPKPTALTIRDNAFNAIDLSNKCLQKLFCENFRLIPRLVWKLNNLVELKITSCELTEIPLKLHDLGPNLRVLDMSSNHINCIDGSFVVSMKRLKSLDLNHNNLDYIPIEIKLMASLERLNVSHNRLSQLPYTLGTISSLKYLDISHNSFNCLNYSFVKRLLHHIRCDNLNVSENSLRLKPFQSTIVSEKPFPTLQSLTAAKIVSEERLLFSCHQILPKFMYKSIEMSGEKCYICDIDVVDEDMKMGLIYESLQSMAVCLSTSHFPTFPNFPCLQYICHSCLRSRH